MDPNATLQSALDALADDDRETAAELLEALAEWLARGGFSPRVERVSDSADRWQEKRYLTGLASPF